MKKNEKKARTPSVSPRPDGFMSVLLCAIAMGVILIASVIDKFIFPFGNEPLSPIIAQILILFIPAYVFMIMASSGKNTVDQMRDVGVTRLRAKYLFLLIFTAFFAICTSLLLNLIFGGAYPASKGFTLLGAFRAGEQEFSVSSPYLIATYALIPAFVEEFAFRGVIFRSFRDTNTTFASVLSSILYALFFFSPAQIPEAIFCGLIFSFVLITTDSLLSCIAVHFVVNLYRLFLQTNVSQYFLSSHNDFLLVTVVVLAWLLSAALFSAEAARIFRARATDRGTEQKKAVGSKIFDVKELWLDIKSTVLFKPTLITAIICVVLYIAITVVGNI